MKRITIDNVLQGLRFRLGRLGRGMWSTPLRHREDSPETGKKTGHRPERPPALRSGHSPREARPAREGKQRDQLPPYTITVTDKGQITVPSAICERLGLSKGDKVRFYGRNDGTFRARKLIAKRSSDI